MSLDPNLPATRLAVAANADDAAITALHAAVLAHGRSKIAARTALLFEVDTGDSVVVIDANLRAFSPTPAFLAAIAAIPAITVLES